MSHDEGRHQALKHAGANNKDSQLIFFGDSITEAWCHAGDVFTREYSKYNAMYFGIGNERVRNCIYRVVDGEFDVVRPKVIVCMIGTNNSMDSSWYTPEQTAADMREMVDAILERTPDSKILLLGIFPCRGPHGHKKWYNDQVNVIISTYDDGKRIHYMDIGANLLNPDSSFSDEIMWDELHLKHKGYEIWADSIREKLTSLMNA
jgi:hypothetical protein